MIFCDGACSGNPGPGGWGTVIVYPEGRVQELGGGNPETTNNRMEMVGALRGLAALEGPVSSEIEMFTDSTYVIRGITQWIWGWRTRGWKTADGKDVTNRDLWEELSRQVARLKPAVIHWRYVRGHTGVPGNERCDEISVAFSKGQRIQLFDGPLLKYPLPIHDVPENLELPAPRTAEQQKKKEPAFSYLSLQGGIVYRHKTWAECERRVKGQSGAKFKKTKSSADEKEIIKGWGLDPNKTEIRE